MPSTSDAISDDVKTPDPVPENYNVPYVWLDGEIIDAQKATVPLMAYTLHYGVGVFEGIRAYEGVKGPAVFRLREHMERLHRSAHMVRMELPCSVDELVKGACDVLAKNGMRSGYV